MKNYAERLKDYIGKKGELSQQDEGYWIFFLQKSPPDVGKAKLIDTGIDYAEFSVANRYRFIPLNLLVLDVE